MKKIQIILLSFIVLILTHGCSQLNVSNQILKENTNTTVFLFSSQDELYKTINKFGKKELGIPLKLEAPNDKADTNGTPIKTPEDKTNTKIARVYVSHKLKFWDENTLLCSLYVYNDNYFLPPELIKVTYEGMNYDVFSRELNAYQTAAGNKQTVPHIDVKENLHNIVEKIEVIFHEAFHYHVDDKKAGHSLTMKNLSLEEGAATVLSEQATLLFIDKYMPDKDLIEWYRSKNKIREDWFNRTNTMYDSLATIYSSDLPDSVKMIKKGNENNAELSLYRIYAQYYPYFGELWHSTSNPKKSVKLFLKIIKTDTKKTKKRLKRQYKNRTLNIGQEYSLDLFVFIMDHDNHWP